MFENMTLDEILPQLDAQEREPSDPDTINASQEDPTERLKEGLGITASTPTDNDLGQSVEQQAVAKDINGAGIDAVPVSTATARDSAYPGPGKALQYPSDSLSENNNWIVFAINEYSRNTVTESSDATVATESTQLQAASRQLPREGLVVGGIRISPGKKRLEQTITLYMPHQISTSYGMIWGEMETSGVLGTALSQLAKGESIVSTGTQAGSNVMKKFLREGAASVINTMSGGVEYGQALVQNATRTLENPRKEVLFQGAAFRQFQYQFLFTPRDEGESNTIKEIITVFKKHMHPEIADGDGGMYMNYPNEFDIQYKHKGEDNTWMHKILTCVLEQVHVDYAPFGQFSTFTNGAPVAIALQLGFKEIEPLHRGQIDKGY